MHPEDMGKIIGKRGRTAKAHPHDGQGGRDPRGHDASTVEIVEE